MTHMPEDRKRGFEYCVGIGSLTVTNKLPPMYPRGSTYLSRPAEPEPATRLASRGGQSERDCGSSSMPGHGIEEFEPRAQRFAAAQTREAPRVLHLAHSDRTIPGLTPAR
jgi:hypothetical protein